MFEPTSRRKARRERQIKAHKGAHNFELHSLVFTLVRLVITMIREMIVIRGRIQEYWRNSDTSDSGNIPNAGHLASVRGGWALPGRVQRPGFNIWDCSFGGLMGYTT